MDGIIWLFIAKVMALVVLGVVIVGLRRGRFAVQKSSHCPNCQSPMSMRRVSILRSFTLMGGWVCPHCGTKLHRRRAN
jgi:ribosomal protein L37AE/L43A